MVKGYVHSYESGAMVDGPGVRFVLFLSGCPLRCQYCHNPDTWDMKNGQEMDSSEILEKIKSVAQFLKIAKGGVTISGGEPFLQPEFLLEILKGCKKMGVHTAVDTSGFLVNKLSQEILDNTNLFLLDIKAFDTEIYKEVTGVELHPTLEFLDKTREANKKVWVRYVLVPNLTDNLKMIENLAKHLKDYPNVEFIDMLPFHKLGEFKWKKLGLEYKLWDTKTPSKDSQETVRNIFRKEGLKILGD